MLRRGRRGRRGRGLVGAVATTAAVAGTAAVTTHAIHNHQQQKDDEAAQEADEQQTVADLQDQVADLQAQQLQTQMVPAAPVAGNPAGNDITSQLTQLGQLQQSGVLTPDEFAAAKAKLLGM
jgi:uncharacterized membrane protein YebE (DUF533 family)